MPAAKTLDQANHAAAIRALRALAACSQEQLLDTLALVVKVVIERRDILTRLRNINASVDTHEETEP